MRILSGVTILLVCAAALAFTPASAQTQYEGSNIYITGAAPPLDSWSPGSRADLQLLDDGSSGDATASDGVFSRQVTGLTGATRFAWKMAAAGWSPQYPASGDSMSMLPASGTMTFFFDSRVRGDGFLPDNTGGAAIGIVYTSPAAVTSTGTLRVVGGFISELGGNNWDTGDDHGLMVDDGTGGDETAGDGIYTFQATNLAPGTKEFKIAANNTWDYQINQLGYSTSGGNIGFSVLETSDVITIQANIANGTYKVDNSNPTLHPGPPFFAVGVLRADKPQAPKHIPWSDQLIAKTQLYDDGTHGDVLSGDGVYSRRFDGPTTAGLYLIQIRQWVGNAYPGSGQFPFETTVAAQPVLVQFDVNALADGAQPASRFVWVDPESRYMAQPDAPNTIFPYVQAVGNWQTAVGGASNFNNNDPLFQMFDDGPGGGHGDLVADDGIYAASFTALADITGGEYKAIAKQGNWDFQMGGPGEGYTSYGNNAALPLSVTNGQNFVLQVDTVTGRIKADIDTTTPTAMQRPATIDAIAPTTAANGSWALYQ